MERLTIDINLLLKVLPLFFPHESIKNNERNRKYCLSFIKKIIDKYTSIERIGEQWLWNYLVFQHQYWRDLDIQRFNINQIYGLKALNRFLTRDTNYDWLITEHGLKYDRQKFSKYFYIVTSTLDVDEKYRKIRLNQQDGFNFCITFTSSLYSEKSSSCSKCKYKEECIILTKQIYSGTEAKFKNKTLRTVRS